jgi:hypothetical protein
MIFEFQVVTAVATWLRERGFEIHQALAESERGDDIVATAPGGSYRLFIEAKGESSSKASSKRFGKPFTNNQVKTHVAVAFYRAAQMLQNTCELPLRVALAFPDNADHRRVVSRIGKTLGKLEIEVFWVSNDGTVSVEGLTLGYSGAVPNNSFKPKPLRGSA